MAVITIKSAVKEDEQWGFLMLPQVCQVTNTKFILKISVGKTLRQIFPWHNRCKSIYSTNLSVYITFYNNSKATNVLLQSGRLINFIRIWNDKDAGINEELTICKSNIFKIHSILTLSNIMQITISNIIRIFKQQRYAIWFEYS